MNFLEILKIFVSFINLKKKRWRFFVLVIFSLIAFIGFSAFIFLLGEIRKIDNLMKNQEEISRKMEETDFEEVLEQQQKLQDEIDSVKIKNYKKIHMLIDAEKRILYKAIWECNNNKQTSIYNNMDIGNCYLSRFFYDDISSIHINLLAFEVLTCIMNEKSPNNGQCVSIIGQNRIYKEPVTLDKRRLQQSLTNKILQNNLSIEGCETFSAKDIPTEFMLSVLQIVYSLNVKIDYITGCGNNSYINILTQKEGHNARRTAASRLAGCSDEYCLENLYKATRTSYELWNN